MTRKTFVQINGVLYEKGTEPISTSTNGEAYPAILPDLPDFVSPIDGRRYSGRSGLREHCRRHDVVPNVELKGLPTFMTNSDTRSTKERRADAARRKELIINAVNRHYK